MLKRLWLVVSVLWTALLVYAVSDGASARDALPIMAIPWVCGPLVFYSFRFIFRGRFTP